MAVNSNPPVQLDPSQDQGHQIAFINQNFQSLANSLNPYILSDGTNNRLLIGKDSTGNYVVKVSKAGFDAFNAADANLIFNSSQDTFKIVSSGNASNAVAATLTSGASSTTTTAHGLGYLPAIQGYLQGNGDGILTNGTYYQTPLLLPGLYGGIWQPGVAFNLSVDSTNVYTTVTNNTSVGISGIGTCVFKYYLLQETAN